jgi:anaerobic magnesium-protoporphyrin IX monomethyl ester cyclase
VAKVLFINPVVREEDVPRHIPYGIALLAAIARNEGHQVAVYDANAWRQPIEKVGEACKADAWDVVAIGGLTTTYNFIKEACRIAKAAAPDSILIAGGGFLTSMPEEIMRWISQIDLGLVGECFRTWPEVLSKVDQKDFDFTQTLGVIHRQDGEPVLNETRPVIHDLDSLPFPAWDLFPLEEVYFKNSSSLFSEEAHLAQRRIDINGSYGCSLICRYCWHLGTTGDMLIQRDESRGGKNDVVFTYGRNIRYHSPRYIVEMVSVLKRDYAIDFANFLDENLMTMEASSGRKWLGQICDEWDKAGLRPTRGRASQPGVFWSGTSHAGLAREDTLRRMHESGCTHLVYGLESFDPDILGKLGKGTNRQNNIDSIGKCMSTGIIPIPNIIIGFPDETIQSIRNTITALIELGIHAKPHFATAYPGSEWYYAYKEDIRAQYGGDLEAYIRDLGDATKITATISHNFTGVELLGLQECVARRDLRLLDQFERAWKPREALTVKHESFNFKPKKLNGPKEVIPIKVAA